MKKIKLLVLSALLVAGVGFVLVPVPAGAVNAIDAACSDASNKDSVICKSQATDNVGSIVGTIVNLLLFLLGLAAVIVIIIGGIRYTVSGGNEKQVEEAKNMILYAVIGLVIAFSAYAIVNWVLHAFGKA